MLISAHIPESEHEAEVAGVSHRVHRQTQMEMTRNHVTRAYRAKKSSLGFLVFFCPNHDSSRGPSPTEHGYVILQQGMTEALASITASYVPVNNGRVSA